MESRLDHRIHQYENAVSNFGESLSIDLRVGSKITWHSVGKMSSLLGTFADSLCQVIFVRSLKGLSEKIVDSIKSGKTDSVTFMRKSILKKFISES